MRFASISWKAAQLDLGVVVVVLVGVKVSDDDSILFVAPTVAGGCVWEYGVVACLGVTEQSRVPSFAVVSTWKTELVFQVRGSFEN